MKKTLAVVLALILLIACVSVPVSAAGASVDLQDAEIYCTGGRERHVMVAWGAATVYSGPPSNRGSIAFSGYSWKCSGCGTMLATEGSPLISGVIGRYAFGDSNTTYNKALSIYYGGVDGSLYGNWKQDDFFGKAYVFTYSGGVDPSDLWSYENIEETM